MKKSKNDKLTPDVRFRGYTDDWKQRRLGDVATIVGGGTPSTKNKDYWNGTINWYSPAEIDNEVYVNSSQRKITKLGLTKSSAFLLPIGTVLFTSRAGIGKTAILKTEACTNQGFQSIIPSKGKINSYFIYTMTPQLKHYGETHGAGSTFVEVSGTQMSKMSIKLPKYNEQICISKIFKKLDSLITLLQRKQKQLQHLKKAMLQKMFPKNDSQVPEIRFNGFRDVWKQQKLGNVASYRNGKAHEKDIDPSGKYVVVNSKFVSSNGTVRKYSNKLIEPLSKGEITFVLSDVPNGKALAKTFLIDQNDTYSLNQRIAGILPKQETSSYFLSTLLNRNSYFLKFDDGVGQTNLLKNDVIEWKTFYPSYFEQKKVGTFFKQLDSLITFNQQKLDYLTQQKKYLLQKMFI